MNGPNNGPPTEETILGSFHAGAATQDNVLSQLGNHLLHVVADRQTARESLLLHLVHRRNTSGKDSVGDFRRELLEYLIASHEIRLTVKL